MNISIVGYHFFAFLKENTEPKAEQNAKKRPAAAPTKKPAKKPAAATAVDEDTEGGHTRGTGAQCVWPGRPLRRQGEKRPKRKRKRQPKKEA